MKQLLKSYLHSQLQQYAADTQMLWSDTASMHIILRVTHRSGKMRLLSLLSLLSTCIHGASVVVLLSSKAAQQLLLQAIQAINREIRQLLTSAAAAQVTGSASASASAASHPGAHNVQQEPTGMPHINRLHAEALTLDCGSPIVTISWEPTPSYIQHPPRPDPKYVFMMADHSICTDDAHLRSFWGHLHHQHHQQQQQQQLQLQLQLRLQLQQQPAARMLNATFGHLGSLWRMVSATYSLPGLASTLTDSLEPGFTTHHVQTALPADCIAHPMMLPADPDMQEIQRRVVPTADCTLLQTSRLNEGGACPPWFGLRPGLLQWLATVTEAAAAAPEGHSGTASDAKLLVVIGSCAQAALEFMDYTQASSSLSVAVLESDGPDNPQFAMLLTTADCFVPLVKSVEDGALSVNDKQEYINRVQERVIPPMLSINQNLTTCQKFQAMCAALSAAQAKHEQPVHGVILLSWEALHEGFPLQSGQAVTDLYLCDLADSVGQGSKAPLTEMAAKALAMISSQLCGAHDR